MKVLMISGDRKMGPGYSRFDLQAGAVETLTPLYVGRREFLKALFFKGSFDVVTSQDPFARGMVAWVIALRSGAKLNLQVHADLARQSWWKRLLARMVLRQAHSVRVVSEQGAKQVRALGVRSKVTTLPVFVDMSAYTSVVRRPHEGKQVLWVGRFEDEKNPLQALEIMRRVLPAVPEARLIMLGAGSKEDELRVAARALPVEFPGWQNPAEYLADADVVLSTSLAESYGASMVEALAAGVPVVAPDVGVAKEAGAQVVSRDELARATIDVLQKKVEGKLRIPVLSPEEWSQRWRDSLI